MPHAPSSSCPTSRELEQLAAGDSVEPFVRQHVEACAACAHRVDEIRRHNELLFEAAQASREARGSAVTPLSDELIAGYEVLSELHRGGQGVVYLAMQQATSRRVALKVLLAGALATSRQRRRFEREIEFVASLQHPNIVTIHDSGVTSDGRHYFAMEYIEGRPLDEAVRPGVDPPDARGVLHLFARICAAVGYAHQRGVIHRDLKPSNILIDPEGEPHIVDFGLAKALAPDTTDEARPVTVTGEFMGTLAYASPEQAVGESHHVDVRSDVYSLGVLLYQMLTAHFPYSVTGSMSSILRTIAEADPIPPTAWSRRTRRSRSDEPVAATAPYRINDEIETIILKTLAKEKERRYQSAQQLERDIRHYLAGEPIDAKRDSTWYVLRKTIRRHRIIVGAAAAALVFATALAINTSMKNRRIAAEAERSESAYRMVMSLVNMANPHSLRRTNSGGPGPAGGLEPGGIESIAQTLRDAARLLDEGAVRLPSDEALLRHLLGEVYLGRELFEDAEAQLRKVVTIREAELGPRDPETIRALRDLANSLYEQGRGKVEEAEDIARQAYRRCQDVHPPAHDETLMSAATLARILHAASKKDQAVRLLRDSVAIARDHRGRKDPATLSQVAQLAEMLNWGGRYDEARELAREAVTGLIEVVGEEDERAAFAMRILADTLAGRNNEEAERWARRAIGTYEHILLPGHPEELKAKLVLSGILFKLNRLDEAIELAEQVYDVRRRTLGLGHYDTLWSMNNLAYFIAASGEDLDRAESIVREALDGCNELFGPEFPETLNFKDSLAVILWRQGRLDEAEEIFQEILKVAPRVTETSSRWRVGWEANYGDLLVEMNRYEDAERQLRKAYDYALTEAYGLETKITQRVIRSFVTLYEDWNKPEQADAYRSRLLPEAGTPSAREELLGDEKTPRGSASGGRSG